MCKVSDKIKFCTCAAKSTSKLKNYWILHRFDKNKDVYVIGDVMMPPFIDYKLEIYNRKLLLKRVNEVDAFDIDLHPKSKDRLQLTFTCEMFYSPLNYGYSFNKGKWIEEEFHYLEWMWHHEKAEFGKITNVIDKGIPI